MRAGAHASLSHRQQFRGQWWPSLQAGPPTVEETLSAACVLRPVPLAALPGYGSGEPLHHGFASHSKVCADRATSTAS